ncbi:hypothetical protein D9M71_482740 [compost metagenome]
MILVPFERFQALLGAGGAGAKAGTGALEQLAQLTLAGEPACDAGLGDYAREHIHGTINERQQCLFQLVQCFAHLTAHQCSGSVGAGLVIVVSADSEADHWNEA